MKPLSVFVLVCAVMTLTGAGAPPEEEKGPGFNKTELQLFKRSTCYGQWTEYNGRCYHYVSTPMSWARAERYCESMGANLVSVHNAFEYTEIQKIIKTITHNFVETWIGASDAQMGDIWLWSDGRRFDYSNWCSGVTVHSSRHCSLMNCGASHCWNYMRCNAHRPAVCACNVS